MKLTMSFLMVFTFGCGVFAADAQTRWHKVEPGCAFTVNGLGWYGQNGGDFCRLPLARKDDVVAANPATWNLSECPSTACVRFKTDSSRLALRITPGSGDAARFDMWHMSSVAVSGMDLYVGPPGKQDFWLNTHPKEGPDSYEEVLFENKPGQMREFTLYLPSYTSLKALEIGLDPNSVIADPTPYKYPKPIVVYGTSITQGGCASRGSNSFVGIVGRRLNSEVINLGFSGSGCGEEILAELISQLDASVYIVDSVANMSKFMESRYETFVRILRSRRPEIPVVLMTKIHYARELDPAVAAEYDRTHKPLFETYRKLKDSGDKNIYLFDAGAIIKTGGDHPTVDGVHMTDAGFYAIADQLTPFLEKILSAQTLSD